MTLPERFPIFPLPNVVLFPEVRLPLHIFEPRYREMTEAALQSDGVIGMVLLRPNADASLRDAPIFDVGCCGPILESRRLPDGRYALILKGEHRFRVVREVGAAPYRIAEAAALPDVEIDRSADEVRSQLADICDEAARLFVESSERSQPGALARLRRHMRTTESVAFIHALAFGLDCTPLEKQGLLEAPGALERGRLLIGLLEFRRAERQHPPASGRPN